MAPKAATTPMLNLSPASGAIYKPLHVERQVKIYPIQEHELTTINMFSSAVTICASIVSGTTVFLLSIAWDLIKSKEPMVQKMGWSVIVGGIVVILISGIVGGWALWSKNTELQKILKETRPAG